LTARPFFVVVDLPDANLSLLVYEGDSLPCLIEALVRARDTLAELVSGERASGARH
jgi:hypothetical protein